MVRIQQPLKSVAAEGGKGEGKTPISCLHEWKGLQPSIFTFLIPMQIRVAGTSISSSFNAKFGSLHTAITGLSVTHRASDSSPTSIKARSYHMLQYLTPQEVPLMGLRRRMRHHLMAAQSIMVI